MPVTSILFAAGQGKRLRPLSEAIPKPALPVLDVPLGAFGLEALGRGPGVTLVNVGPGGDRIVSALKPYGRFEVLEEKPAAFGTAGTLAALQGRLAEVVMTLNSDSLTDLDPADLLATHREAGSAVTVAARSVQSGADLVATGGLVVEFVDRRKEPDRSGLQFIGACALQSAMVDDITPRAPAGLAEHVLVPAADAGELAVHVHDGYFLDVGTFERYLRAGLDAIGGLAPSPPEPWPGHLEDVEGGRAYVGPDAAVDPSCLCDGAIVLAGAQVDPRAQLQRTIVLPGERVPAVDLTDVIWHGGRPLPVR